jgi:hypothetical protein
LGVQQLSPTSLLKGGVALLPLAPISAVTKADLPAIIQRMKRRLSSRRGRKHAEIAESWKELLGSSAERRQESS